MVAATAAALMAVSSAHVGAQHQLARGVEHRADVLLETGPFDEAADALAIAIDLAPHDGYLVEKLALARYYGGDFDGALAALDDAASIFGDVGIMYLRAEILARRGAYDEAARSYAWIEQAFPSHVTPPFMRGQLRLKTGDDNEARAARAMKRLQKATTSASVAFSRKIKAINAKLRD